MFLLLFADKCWESDEGDSGGRTYRRLLRMWCQQNRKYKGSLLTVVAREPFGIFEFILTSTNEKYYLYNVEKKKLF